MVANCCIIVYGLVGYYRATAMLSAVYAVVVCLCVCVCLSVCHTLVLYQNG